MNAAGAEKMRLYELALENGHSASPFVWRIRYALAHKDLPFESVHLGFTEIPAILNGRFKTVPVLERGETAMAESWDIALYLDRTFPNSRPLFATPAEAALVRLTDEWFTAEVLRKMFRIYILDVHNAARPADREYFRAKREKSWFLEGQTLENFAADRESRLPALRDSLAPLRSQLKRYPYMGGQTPNYADYIVLGAFIWVASVGTIPMLKPDDSLRGYVDRGFDLYGGIARDPRIKSLFG
jgi:glutathione S-transferase